MTDPEIADATYVEPITPEFVEKIIAKERRTHCCPPWRPDRAEHRDLPADNGALAKYGVELIGANVEAINKGEDRNLFKGVVEAVKAKIVTATRPFGDLPLDGRRAGRRRHPRRLPGGRPPLLHHGRRRFRFRARRGGAAPHRRQGLTLFADHRGAAGGVHPGWKEYSLS